MKLNQLDKALHQNAPHLKLTTDDNDNWVYSKKDSDEFRQWLLDCLCEAGYVNLTAALCFFWR